MKQVFSKLYDLACRKNAYGFGMPVSWSASRMRMSRLDLGRRAMGREGPQGAALFSQPKTTSRAPIV